MAAVCNSFAKSWPYVHAQLVASRDEPPAAPPAPPLTTTPPLDAPPPDPPSEVQQVLDVDASLLEEQEEEEPPPQRGWFGRFVGNAVSATKHYGGRAAELGGTAALTVGSAVGETVLTVRDKLARDEMHSGGGAAGASAPESAEAAPGADAEANPQIKGLFNRVADGGDHASAAEVSERLGWVCASRRAPRRGARSPRALASRAPYSTARSRVPHGAAACRRCPRAARARASRAFAASRSALRTWSARWRARPSTSRPTCGRRWR